MAAELPRNLDTKDFLGTGSVAYQVVHGQQLPLSWPNLDNRINQDFHGL
jgi:hypothetical protein